MFSLYIHLTLNYIVKWILFHFYLYVYIDGEGMLCIHMNVCTCACWGMEYMWRSNIMYLHWSLFILLFNTKVSHWIWSPFIQLGCLINGLQGSTYLCSHFRPPGLGLQTFTDYDAFTRMLEIGILAQQASSWLSHLLSPEKWILFTYSKDEEIETWESFITWP